MRKEITELRNTGKRFVLDEVQMRVSYEENRKTGGRNIINVDMYC
jgi:hypothetical protein